MTRQPISGSGFFAFHLSEKSRRASAFSDLDRQLKVVLIRAASHHQGVRTPC